MNSNRKIAIIAGVLFIVATFTAIVGLILYEPILNDPDYIIKLSANENQVILGAFFELILAFAVIGTSITMFPLLKKQNESIALGYVCGRLLEAVIIVVGIISLLSLLTLSQEFVKASAPNASSFLTAGKLLLAVHNWTFMLGPNFVLAPNTLMLSYLLYRSKLVPRVISGLGFIGATLIFAAALLEMFGLILQISVWGTILAIPVASFEMILAVWLIVKGFNLSAIASESTRTDIN